MPSRTPPSSLPGTLHQVPFLGDDPATRIAPVYAALVEQHASTGVLVLKRFPTGIETFTDRLARAIDGAMLGFPGLLSMFFDVRDSASDSPDTLLTAAFVCRAQIVSSCNPLISVFEIS